MIVAPYLSLKAPKASVFLRFSFNTQGHHRFNPINRRQHSLSDPRTVMAAAVLIKGAVQAGIPVIEAHSRHHPRRPSAFFLMSGKRAHIAFFPQLVS